MTTHIIIGKFTQHGVTNIKDSPKRLEAARKVIKSVGGTLKAFYYTMGQYDFVCITEGNSDEGLLQALFTIGSAGSVQTETMVAVPADQAATIIAKVP